MPARSTGDDSQRDGENPFAVHHVRPGAIPFLFPPDWDAEGLVQRLKESGWRGEIVGPHGSGKSTLVHSLIPWIEARGLKVWHYSLRQGERRLPREAWRKERWSKDALLIIDGYEQLSWLERLRVRWRCKRTGCGLVITTHKPMGLPTLWRTEGTSELASRIVQTLLGTDAAKIEPTQVDSSFRAAQGNLREMLFSLYDVWEARRDASG